MLGNELYLFVDKYDNNTNIEWTIVVPAGQVVRLDFFTFDTEGCCDYNDDWDYYDYDTFYYDYLNDDGDIVSVFDGCTATDPSLGSFHGTDLPPLVISSGNVLHITFTTDGLLARPGFSAAASGLDLTG